MRAIDAVLRKEKGFVDHPADRGGPTNMGIAIDTLSSWRGYPVSAADVRALERDEAIEIYHARYFQDSGLHRLDDDAVISAMLDMTAHHGERNAVKILQKACGAPIDGKLGPVTAAVANAMRPKSLLRDLIRERVLFMARIARRDPSQLVFIVGWLRRAFLMETP
jgi:lysozyme family protein